MSNGRHHRPPADTTDTRIQPWKRPRVRFGAAAAVIGIVIALGGHQAGHMHADAGHSEHTHTAATVIEQVTPKACGEALDHADQAFAAAKEFGQGMADFHAGALDLLRRGDSGHAVEQLQKYLNEEADADLQIDAIFGPKTEKAVKAYRKAQGKHKADSEDFLASLADARGQFKEARQACQRPGGGGS